MTGECVVATPIDGMTDDSLGPFEYALIARQVVDLEMSEYRCCTEAIEVWENLRHLRRLSDAFSECVVDAPSSSRA
jgi:hypothetical protein